MKNIVSTIIHVNHSEKIIPYFDWMIGELEKW